MASTSSVFSEVKNLKMNWPLRIVLFIGFFLEGFVVFNQWRLF
jgi:hypothetical protein